LIINVLSGKGGTGKTTVSTNLAYVLHEECRDVQLLDADVEEPNTHIFFDVEFQEEKNVDILLPVVDKEKCTLCGECGKVCQFGAIVVFPTTVMVFDYLCHGCGACSMVCPENAISERPKSIGKISFGFTKEGIKYGMGLLNIGEPSGVRIIRELKKNMKDAEITVIDSPPGTSCPVVESLRRSDFAILVTESTPFGLHDLKMAMRVVKEMGIKMGVVVNRYDPDFKELEDYLQKENVPILMKIPFDQRIAELYSKGEIFSKHLQEWREKFLDMFKEIERIVGSDER
jgi:MinD superfamily P-loop ATPase